MINYSISLRANPSDQDAPKKAYANAQYSEIMTLDKFAEHISTHEVKELPLETETTVETVVLLSQLKQKPDDYINVTIERECNCCLLYTSRCV